MPDAHRAALLSLSETTGAADLARAIAECGIALIATSGTKAILAREGIEARDVEELTGVPPLFDGRVKTLHPTIFGAILYDRDRPEHRDEARRRDIPEIAIVSVTLYPPPEIDIGGVALLRAAAKNFSHVSVLCDPSQYADFVTALRNGGPALEERRALAAAALRHVSEYDAGNAEQLCHPERSERECHPERSERSERSRGTQTQLRYGENPHQFATFTAARDAVPEQLHGKALSYNNLLDLDAALRLLARNASAGEPESPLARAAIVKHTIPCGVAQRANIADALRLALDADRTSAYGGIVAVDAPLTADAATSLADVFLEIVAAPAFDDEALTLLRRKRNLRIMRFLPGLPQRLASERSLRSALGGVLAEEPNPAAPAETMRIVSRRRPTNDEWRDLRFAWDVVAHVKSNGIVVVNGGVTRGICAGQTNRVSAVEIAARRAGTNARGAACASDGFFPFSDGLQAAISAGCSAVIAPGGSIRDDEVIAAADAAGIALVFSSYRYFLH